MDRAIAKYLPLTETTYYILISLLEPRHGYGIKQNVEALTNRRVSIAPGTMYGALNSLVGKGWIVPKSQDDSGRRKVYAISELGHRIIRQEVRRIAGLDRGASDSPRAGRENR